MLWTYVCMSIGAPDEDMVLKQSLTSLASASAVKLESKVVLIVATRDSPAHQSAVNIALK